MRCFVLVVALWSGGCALAEYVLPPASAGDSDSAGSDTEATGDTPTGGSGDTGGCGQGESLCEGGCVDLHADEAHCGRCDEACKSDEMCVVGECRDVAVVDCASCPCADQCPPGGGVDSDGMDSDGEGGGSDPQKSLCCEVETDEGDPQVLCIMGGEEDVLVCPESAS